MLNQRKIQTVLAKISKSVLFLIFMLSSTTYAQTSWQKVESGTWHDLSSVARSPLTGTLIAIGDRVCIRSIDDGKTWSAASIPNIGSWVFYEVDFSATGKAHAVGEQGVRIYSNDDGLTWLFYPSQGGSANIYGVSFPVPSTDTRNVGVAVAIDGTVYKTTNDGKDWSSKKGPADFNYITDVDLITTGFDSQQDYYTGLAVSTTGNIWRTLDFAENWTNISSGTTSELNYVDAAGFICGSEGTVLISTDNGVSWVDRSPKNETTNLNSITASGDTIWAVGSKGKIIKSTNSGINWITENSGTTNSLFSILLIGNDKIVVVGRNGTVLRYGFPVRTAYNNTPAPVPGKIEAEEYDIGANGTAYYDLSSGNEGGVFRDDDVDIQECSDVGGGYNVGWTENGEWLEYTFNSAESGTFTVSARVASGLSDNSFSIQIDGEQTLNATIQNTGGWQTWQNKTLGQVQLSQGQHVLRVNTLGGSINYNYFEISQGVTALNSTEELPQEFSLEQNYPNPFNPATTIKYTVATYRNTPQYVILSIYDLLGRKVATLVNKEMMPGAHSVVFDAADLPSGTYFYRLRAGDLIQTKKMLLLR